MPEILTLDYPSFYFVDCEGKASNPECEEIGRKVAAKIYKVIVEEGLPEATIAEVVFNRPTYCCTCGLASITARALCSEHKLQGRTYQHRLPYRKHRRKQHFELIDEDSILVTSKFIAEGKECDREGFRGLPEFLTTTEISYKVRSIDKVLQRIEENEKNQKRHPWVRWYFE